MARPTSTSSRHRLRPPPRRARWARRRVARATPRRCIRAARSCAAGMHPVARLRRSARRGRCSGLRPGKADSLRRASSRRTTPATPRGDVGSGPRCPRLPTALHPSRRRAADAAVEMWDTFPFDGEMRPRPLQPPADRENRSTGRVVPTATRVWRTTRVLLDERALAPARARAERPPARTDPQPLTRRSPGDLDTTSPDSPNGQSARARVARPPLASTCTCSSRRTTVHATASPHTPPHPTLRLAPSQP